MCIYTGTTLAPPLFGPFSCQSDFLLQFTLNSLILVHNDVFLLFFSFVNDTPPWDCKIDSYYHSYPFHEFGPISAILSCTML